MPTMEIQVERFSAVSSRPFEEVVDRLTAVIGHPDMNAFHGALIAATTVAELERVVQGAIGSSELMEFARYDAGKVLGMERGGRVPRNLRLVVGNPVIMKEMARYVPDAHPMAASRPLRSPEISTPRSSPCSRRPRDEKRQPKDRHENRQTLRHIRHFLPCRLRRRQHRAMQ
jgi:hypothetical protein